MAKLNGVKTVEPTNGEITKVAYGGAEYLLTDAPAVNGDLILSSDSCVDVDYGAFYVCTGGNSRDVYLRDNVGFPRDRNQKDYATYRKIEEANAMTTFKKGDVVVTVKNCGWAKSLQGLVSEGVIGKVKTVEGDLLTVKFGKKQPLDEFVKKRSRKNFVLRTSEIRLATADEAASIAKKKKQADEITFKGAKYRKVDRKAQAGDVVVFRNPENDERWITLGKPYEAVTGDAGELEFEDNDGDRLYLYLDERRSTNNTDVYEKVEAKYVPQEGDIVVVTANTTASRNAVGDIGKIGKLTSYDATVDVPSKPNVTGANGNHTKLSEVRKATPAEVDAYEKALHKASFSVGDYVKIVKSERGNVGKIVKITKVADGERHRRLDGTIELSDFIGQLVGNSQDYGFLAEQFVKATEQEVADASKPKFKAGDSVVFESDTMMSGIIIGKVYDAKMDEDGDLYVTNERGASKCFAMSSGRLYGKPRHATDAELAPKLKAGDFVKITDGTSSIVNGETYEVFERSYGLYIVDNDGDERGFPLVFGAVKYEVIPAVDAKWAKIGRKVGEYKVGDVVEIVNPTCAYGKCELAVISEITGEDIWYENKRNKGGKGIERKWHTFADFIELIAPVESLFNA